MGLWSKWNEAHKKAVAEQKQSIKLEYLGGHPKIKPGTISIIKGNEPRTLTLQESILSEEESISVTKIEWDEKGKRSLGKAAAGAVVAGVLTGGLGAVVGAAIGGRKKDNSLAILTFNDGLMEGNIYFRADAKEYQKLAALLY